jgi:hypothetical protein
VTVQTPPNAHAPFGRSPTKEHADAPHPVWLPSTRDEWPCAGRADKRDKFTPSHSITPSAGNKDDSEMAADAR